MLLSMLQREGRLIDFLQENVASFSDADVGAAARIVHEGCRKVVQQYLSLKPVLPESEGAPVTCRRASTRSASGSPATWRASRPTPARSSTTAG